MNQTPHMLLKLEVLIFFKLFYIKFSNSYNILFLRFVVRKYLSYHIIVFKSTIKSCYMVIEIFISVDILFLILAVNSYRRVIEGSRLTARRKVVKR